MDRRALPVAGAHLTAHAAMGRLLVHMVQLAQPGSGGKQNVTRAISMGNMSATEQQTTTKTQGVGKVVVGVPNS